MAGANQFSMNTFSDADFRATMLRTLRLLGILTAVAVPLVCWKMGWRSGLFTLLGAVISGSGLWEWLRLMSAVMSRMDAGATAKPMASVLIGFVLRLVLIAAALYVSLKFLNGSIYALAIGLGLGLFALFFEALRLLKAWTV